MERASETVGKPLRKWDVDIDLRVQEVAQDAILQDEAEYARNQQSKAGSNKISVRHDLFER